MIPLADVRSILIVKLSSIGDVVQSLPVLAALRRRFPEAYIGWAVKPAAAEILVGSPHLSETLILGGSAGDAPGMSSLPPLTAPLALRQALHRRRFELAFDLQGLLKSAVVAYLSGAPDRIGFANRQEGAFLFNNRRLIPDRRDVHAVQGYLGFAEVVGAPIEPLDFTIATTEADRQAVDRLVGDRERLVALIPGARWLSKRWPAARFAAVADALAAEFACSCVVVGGPGDRALAVEMAETARAPILDLTGRTSLKQLTALFRRCQVVISNETGPVYVAAAAGAPTVTIFGPTDPLRLGPYGEGHAKVVADMPCAPCRRRDCRPLRCMEAISADRVIAAARAVLGQVSPEARVGRK